MYVFHLSETLRERIYIELSYSKNIDFSRLTQQHQSTISRIVRVIIN